MASLLNLARMTTATTGTGTVTLGAAVSGYLTFASAGAVDGKIYRYGIKDGANSETGYGTYTAAGTTFARTSVRTSTNANAAISLSGSAEIFITPLAEDFLNVSPPQGRLTLQTATPAMTSTQSAKTTIYYTPYVGQLVPLYDGTSFNMTDTGGEISVATTDITKNPAAIGASKVNDWFVWSDAGTIRLSHGPDWTSDTVRSAGTALVMVNGTYLNNAAITNGPAASRGTYVGTTRSNASSQLDWILGAAASGGTAALLNVWNAYNRVQVGTTVMDNGLSYTYASSTIRQARASSGNQINFVFGLSEDAILAKITVEALTAATAGSFALKGIGVDTTTAITSSRAMIYAASAAGFIGQGNVSYTTYPGIGYHFVSHNERTDATPTTVTMNNGSLDTLSLFTRM